MFKIFCLCFLCAGNDFEILIAIGVVESNFIVNSNYLFLLWGFVRGRGGTKIVLSW